MTSQAIRGFPGRSAAPSDASAHVRAWTAARFGLGPQETVMVAEIACRLPGCPPLETVIVFWTDGNRRHRINIFKPVAEVTQEDLPPAWLKASFLDDRTTECGCC